MVDTLYATTDELRPRVSLNADDSVASNPILQQILNASAYVVDQVSRMPPAGQIAFTATASAVRYFDDYFSGVICIDDALTITEVRRNNVVIDPSAYTLSPYNEAPYTAIIFDAGGSGPKAIKVTGTWGYCLDADRPAVVKEATLVQAERMYEKLGLATADQIAASTVDNPWAFVDGYVLMMLKPLQRSEAAKMYRERRVIVKQS